jgi:hypothetical protein
MMYHALTASKLASLAFSLSISAFFASSVVGIVGGDGATAEGDGADGGDDDAVDDDDVGAEG